jgi:septum site-determining protein MinC
MGDVNDGAEVIAGENIVVLGSLRGLAHAGAKGNKDAIIAASIIEAPQLRIANVVREIEKEEINTEEIKEYAYLDEKDNMVIE